MNKETPIYLEFRKWVSDKTGIPERYMRRIVYEGGDIGVTIDGVGDISMLKTDFFTTIK